MVVDLEIRAERRLSGSVGYPTRLKLRAESGCHPVCFPTSDSDTQDWMSVLAMNGETEQQRSIHHSFPAKSLIDVVDVDDLTGAISVMNFCPGRNFQVGFV